MQSKHMTSENANEKTETMKIVYSFSFQLECDCVVREIDKATAISPSDAIMRIAAQIEAMRQTKSAATRVP